MKSISRQLLLFALLLISSGTLIVGLYWAYASQQWLLEREIESIELSALKSESDIAAYIKGLDSNILFFVNHEPVKGIVRASHAGGKDPVDGSSLADWMHRCEINFISQLESNPDQFQIRLIGLADGGREIVRVERAGNEIVVIPPAGLQQKEDRVYFQEAVKLGNGEIYYSSIDLNVEHGKVVEPYLPTLRVASPVYATSGELFGFVIINTSVEALLNRYAHALSRPGAEVFILGDGDQFLRHPDQNKQFGRDLGRPFGLHDELPVLAEEIHQWVTQLGSQADLKTFAQGDDNLISIVKSPVGEQGNYLLGVIKSQKNLIMDDVQQGLAPSLLITLLLTLLGLIPAWILARLIARPIEVLTRTVHRIGEDGHSETILPLHRGDEIGRLSRAFHEMQERVHVREEQLKDEAARTRAVFDASIAAVITIDKHGIIETVNPETLSMFGYHKEELIGQNISILTPSPHRENHDAYLHRYLETGERRIIGSGRELTAVRKDGSTFPIYLSVNTFTYAGEVMFTGMIMDISDQKILQDTLRASDEIKRIMESTHDLYISTDAKYQIDYTNVRAEKSLVLHHADGEAVNLLDLIPELNSAQGKPLLEALAEGREGHTELHLANPPGWFLASCYPARASYHWQLVDISELKQQQLALQEKSTQLQQTNRELNDFAFVASHDLQEPLRKIQAFSDRLLKKYADVLDERGQDYLQRMNAAASRMSTLIQSLLQLSRVSSREMPFEKVDLNRVVDEIRIVLDEAILEKHASISVEPLPLISGDPMQIAQLIQNLLGNALKFHKPDTAPEIRIYHRTITDGKIELVIEDNGIGIGSEFYHKVFEPFERLHGRENYAGTGMGLAICRRIVERHGGSISIETDDDKPGGCRFVIVLTEIVKDRS